MDHSAPVHLPQRTKQRSLFLWNENQEIQDRLKMKTFFLRTLLFKGKNFEIRYKCAANFKKSQNMQQVEKG